MTVSDDMSVASSQLSVPMRIFHQTDDNDKMVDALNPGKSISTCHVSPEANPANQHPNDKEWGPHAPRSTHSAHLRRAIDKANQKKKTADILYGNVMQLLIRNISTT